MIAIAVFLINFVLSEVNDDDLFEFTFIHTNDVHGWINTNKHVENRDVDFGDFENFLEHMKDQDSENKKVLAFDSGDWTQGTGLSDLTKIHGSFILDVAKNLSIDAFTIGNHEIYDEPTVDYIADETYEQLGERYVSCNVKHSNESKKMANDYRIINVDGFGKILVIGLIYGMEDQAKNCIVTPFSKLNEDGKLEWIETLLADDEVRLIVMLAHIPPESDETTTAIEIVSSKDHHEGLKKRPIVFLNGHDHILYYKNSSNLTKVESMCFFQYISVTSFKMAKSKDAADQSLKEQSNEHLNTTLSILMKYTGVDKKDWGTEQGLAIHKAIVDEAAKLNLSYILGYSPQYYNNSFEDKTKNSLYNLMTCTVYPKMKPIPAKDDENRFVMYAINSASLRSDLMKGDINNDDVYSIDPFGNKWASIRNITANDMTLLMNGDVVHLSTAARAMQHKMFLSRANERRARSAIQRFNEEEEAEWNIEVEKERLLEMKDQEKVRMMIAARVKLDGSIEKAIDNLKSIHRIVGYYEPFKDRFYHNEIDVKDGNMYDITSSNYDCNTLQNALNSHEEKSKTYKMDVYDDDAMTDTFVDYITKYMPPKSSKLSKGAIIAITVSVSVIVVVIVVVLVVIIVILVKRSKRKSFSKFENVPAYS